MTPLSSFFPSTNNSGAGAGAGSVSITSWSAPVAKGSETLLSPPYSFTQALVFINGVMQDQTRSAFIIVANEIVLSDPLEKGDESQVIIFK